MTTDVATPGTLDNSLLRLKRLLPPWFGDDATPVLDGVLLAPASVVSFIYTLYRAAKVETRIATADGGWLELASTDFFGATLPRLTGEADSAYRTRIIASIFKHQNTRASMIQALTGLGLTVRMVEPRYAGDLGGWNSGVMGYGQAGRWGSRSTPNQAFATVTRPAGSTLTPAQIYAAAESVRTAGVILWLRIV